MPDNQDPLNKLWQGQQVEKPDIQVLSRQWRKVQLKQRFYAGLDILGLLFPVIALVFFAEYLDKFTRIYFGVLTLMLCPFVAYIVWLRRFSIGWSSVSTDQYVQQIKKQIASNIKIAYLTKHSIWPIGLLIILHHLGLFYFDLFPIDKLMRKSLVSAGFFVVMFPSIWIWATRRENRFKGELADLNRVLGN
jgi:hypothetical protein